MTATPHHPRMRVRNDGSIVLIMRSDMPIPSKSIGIIANVIIGVALLLVFGFAFVKCVMPWFRSSRQATAAKEKALADQKAWYASTRPVVQQPNTPRLLDAYTRAPHIQRREECFGVDLEKNASQYGCERVASTTSQVNEKMRASCDLGLQGLSDRDSSSTATTHASFGVAVPVKIPGSSSPAVVYYAPRS